MSDEPFMVLFLPICHKYFSHISNQWQTLYVLVYCTCTDNVLINWDFSTLINDMLILDIFFSKMYYCWKFWSWEMKYHHESGVESKSFHHKWRGEAESRVMKWFWFNDRRVMIFHFSTPEFSAISFQKFIHWRTIKYFTITIST